MKFIVWAVNAKNNFMNKKLNAYLSVEETVPSGYDFEKTWYTRAVMVITMIQTGQFDPVKSHKLLLEICHDLTWIKLNLNQQLTMEHRALLAQIFDSSIEIVNGYIVDKDSSYLDIVIKSLKTIAEPYQYH